MTPTPDRIRQMADEYTDEEAVAASVETHAQPDQTVISVRVPTEFAHTLKARAAAEHLPTSTYIRRLLMSAVVTSDAPVLTEARVEEIATRIARELHAV